MFEDLSIAQIPAVAAGFKNSVAEGLLALLKMDKLSMPLVDKAQALVKKGIKGNPKDVVPRFTSLIQSPENFFQNAQGLCSDFMVAAPTFSPKEGADAESE